jgi:hypothetical protein
MGMEGSMAQIAMEWPRLSWLSKSLLRKPVDISKVLALHEAEKRLEAVHMALDERRRISCLL